MLRSQRKFDLRVQLLRLANQLQDRHYRHPGCSKFKQLQFGLESLSGVIDELQAAARRVTGRLGYSSSRPRVVSGWRDSITSRTWALDNAVQVTKAALSASAQVYDVPSLRELYRDLLSLSREDWVDEVCVDLRNRRLIVTTQRVTLEDGDVSQDMGHYVISMNLQEMYEGRFRYDIEAEDQPVALRDNPPPDVHPCVSDGALCEGDAKQAISRNMLAGRWLDVFLLIWSVLSEHPEDNTYWTLSAWRDGEYGGENDEDSRHCASCDSYYHYEDGVRCDRCGHDSCENCSQFCGDCENSFCGNCCQSCTVCCEGVCRGCSVRCSRCREHVCQREECRRVCQSCGCTICDGCAKECAGCDELFCEACTIRLNNREGERVTACVACAGSIDQAAQAAQEDDGVQPLAPASVGLTESGLSQPQPQPLTEAIRHVPIPTISLGR